MFKLGRGRTWAASCAPLGLFFPKSVSHTKLAIALLQIFLSVSSTCLPLSPWMFPPLSLMPEPQAAVLSQWRTTTQKVRAGLEGHYESGLWQDVFLISMTGSMPCPRCHPVRRSSNNCYYCSLQAHCFWGLLPTYTCSSGRSHPHTQVV